MIFAEPYYLNGVWFLAALALFIYWALKKRRSALSAFTEERLFKEVNTSLDLGKKIVKYSVVLFAFLFALLALMRPQWGFQWREVKRRGLDIIVAIDTSKSMLAQDVKPNRLVRSKLALKDLVRRLEGDRVGLIAFSGTAFLQCPLTNDYGGFILALNDLDVDTIPRGGTSISRAINVAMKSFSKGEKKYKVLIVITDGEDHEGDALKAAKEAAAKDGIKIFCVGIGTLEGELIRTIDSEGNAGFLKDKDGNVVKSRLNEAELQKIALATGGIYVRSSGAEFGLEFLYNEKLQTMERRELKSQMTKFYHERFQIPLAIALLLIIYEPFIREKKIK